ncbi:MAG: glycosyltransferase family 4 protein [Thermodesulfovibrionales bacterium]|nr:glycosyltransferase family 4 protein [Thermodesulfovibrionales bacterium]
MKEKLEAENIEVALFNTKKPNILRVFLPFLLLSAGRRYDIFHVHGCSYAGFFPIGLGVLVGKLLKKKIIVTYHGGGAEKFFSLHQKLIKYVFTRADHIIVLSEYLKNIFAKHGLNTDIIPNIIEMEPGNYRARTAFKPVMITTRSLEAVYDLKTAIEAFALVKCKYNDAMLYVVGTGREELALKKYVTEAKIRDVIFTGYIENERIYEYLMKADFWLNPTMEDNMPVSLIEAIQAGLVVVSTNAGGIPFMVEHKKSAWLVDKGDSQAMGEGILYLLANPEICKTLVGNARSSLGNYQWEHIREKILSLYGQ